MIGRQKTPLFCATMGPMLANPLLLRTALQLVSPLSVRRLAATFSLISA